MSQGNKISLLGFVIWFLAALFFMYEFFLRTFVGTLAHQIIPALSLDSETFALIGSAYYFAYAAMQIPVGILADKFGVKIIMSVAILICAVATFLFAHSMGFYSAFFSRILMGFGSSFAFVCLLVIASTWFPQSHFGFFAGISQFIGTMGPLLSGGPLIALMLAYHASWRLSLSMVAFFGVFLFILVILVVRSKPRGGAYQTIYLSHAEPLAKRLKKLIDNPQAWYIAVYSGGVYLSAATLGAIWGTEYLQTRGLPQNIAADAISMIWLGYAIGCPALGALSDHMKRRKPILFGCAALGLIATILVIYIKIKFIWMYTIILFCLGVAASGQNVGFAAIAEHVSESTRATAIGLNNGTILLFGAIAPLLVSYFVSQAAHGRAGHLVASDFYLGFSIMPLFYIISMVITVFFIKETYGKPQKEIIKLLR